VGDIWDVVHGTPHWEKRHEILWYVSRCEMSGFATTLAEKQNCAMRYMAGKRKVPHLGQLAERKPYKNNAKS